MRAYVWRITCVFFVGLVLGLIAAATTFQIPVGIPLWAEKIYRGAILLILIYLGFRAGKESVRKTLPAK